MAGKRAGNINFPFSNSQRTAEKPAIESPRFTSLGFNPGLFYCRSAAGRGWGNDK